MRIRIPLLIAILSLAVGSAVAGDLLRKELGDPQRRDHTVELHLDGITDSRSGDRLAPADLPPRLADVRLLFIGESHTSVEFHRAQLRILQELQRAGRKVMIGLEMYPYTEQEFLDQWSANQLTESGFLELSRWYENWGYHWDYYRDIFLFARDHGLPMYAVNTPREVVSAVRKKGFDELTEEEQAHIPSGIDTDSDDHFALFKAYFEDDEEGFHASMNDEQWRSMFDAQCTWDATMGFNALQALKRHDEPEAILVVLIGAAHLAYDQGVQRQIAQWHDGRMASIIPIDIGGRCDDPVEQVQASYADFIWGVPHEEAAKHPSIGMSTRKVEDSERRTVIHVPDPSPAFEAGFHLGDVLISMDGADLPDRAALNREVARRSWGDRAEVVVRRGDDDVTLTVEFLRTRPEACDEE